MKTPAFSYMGGKARLRNWLLAHFPRSGRYYVEPFAGCGNVFFAARQELAFDHWVLSDINPRLLLSIRSADLGDLPDTVDAATFAWCKANKHTAIAALLEPRITFAGKGYQAGSTGINKPNARVVPYSGRCYKPVCELARTLLLGVDVLTASWHNLALHALSSDDFVYLDPPYVGTQAHYANIDHSALIEALNAASFRWALSGYANDLYAQHLRFRSLFTCERNSEIKSANRGTRTPVQEFLWTNY